MMFHSLFSKKLTPQLWKGNSGDFSYLANELIYDLFLYLTPSEQLMLSLTCLFLRDFFKDLKYHAEYLTLSAHTTYLKPIGYRYASTYYSDCKIYHTWMNLYFPHKSTAADYAQLFFQSMETKPNSPHSFWLRFQNNKPAHRFLIERQETNGLTGKEWILRVPFNNIAKKLTMKNMPEILLMFPKSGKPLGSSFQCNDQYDHETLLNIDHQDTWINLYYQEIVLAYLARDFLRNILLFKNKEISSISQIYGESHLTGKNEYITRIQLNNIDMRSEEAFKRLKESLKLLLTSGQYEKLTNLLNTIYNQHTNHLQLRP